MSQYSSIKAAVNAYIKQNGRREITGRILNAVLNATIDSLGKFYQFAGVATPLTDPENPDQNVCYLAGEPGTYVNFDNIVLENEEIALLFWNGEWTKQRMLLGIQEVTASVDNQVGTPSVDVSYSEGQLVLTFHNLKGDQGETGDAAGFGTIGATVDSNIGTPGVSVQTSGPDTGKNIMFNFTNLKGETGVTSVIATVDNTTGTPQCSVSLNGQQLTLAFTGLKGLQGDTGVSADYPITIVNNLTTNDPTSALSAAMGVQLESEISQLEADLNSLPRGKNYGFFTSSSNLPNDATEEGFAYVGATEPYEIWEFDGTTWTDSGVTANAFTANAGQVQDSVDNYLEEHPTVSGTFLNAAKQKLISLLEKVAFIDGHGQDYIDELTASLFLSPIDHIEAVFTQGTWDCYDIYRLEQLKEHLVVTVYYTDGSHSIETGYTLSGTLAAGTSTLTASVVDGITGDTVTDTFDVTVTATTKLYVDGDECIATTGGWQKKGFNIAAGTPTVAKYTDYMLIKFASWDNTAAAGTLSTVNKINVSSKTKCLVEIELYNETGTAIAWIYYPGTLTESTTQTGAFGSDYSSNRANISVAPDRGTFITGFQDVAVTTTRTEDYISINLNAYVVEHVGYTPGAYLKIKRVAIV